MGMRREPLRPWPRLEAFCTPALSVTLTLLFFLFPCPIVFLVLPSLCSLRLCGQHRRIVNDGPVFHRLFIHSLV